MTSEDIGVVTDTESDLAEPTPVFEGENYSFEEVHFFETRGGKLAETLRMTNDDKFGWPQEFDVILNLYEI